MKRLINDISKVIYLLFYYIYIKAKEVILAKKTLVFVAKRGIKRIEINILGNFMLICLFLWVCSLFIQSVSYKSIIAQEAQKNYNLNKINNILTKEIYKIDKNINNIQDYFMENSFYGRLSKNNIDIIGDKDLVEVKDIIKEIIPNDYKENFVKISRSKSILKTIEDVSKQRIENLSRILALTKLRLFRDIKFDSEDEEKSKEISLNINEHLVKHQGGPFFSNINNIIEAENRVLFDDEGRSYVEILMNLEKFVIHAPLYAPMGRYYISSGFGERIDPLTNQNSQHNGTDFVGRRNEKVISPSSGIVVLARKFGAYGNAIIISHGYGIRTLFGHLKEISVKKGQMLKRGDIIGTQGNTGRSTGEHLHYEVRYNGKKIDPMGFMRAGSKIEEYYQ